MPLISTRRLIDTADSVASRASRRGGRVWRYQGVPCAGIERAVVDEVVRRDDLREAVVAVDMACAARITSLRRIRAYAARVPGRAGRLVLDALALATEDSRSPMESRLRLVWLLDAELPTPLCNRAVYSLDGTFLGCPDLFEPGAGIVGEYDGALHRSRERHRRDVEREDAFRAHGLEVFTIVAGTSRAVQVARMGEARARALARTTQPRWTVDPPPGAWVPPARDLDEELEARGCLTD